MLHEIMQFTVGMIVRMIPRRLANAALSKNAFDRKPVRIKGKWYYFGPDGKAYRNRYGRINGVRYYFDKNGVGRKR